MTFQVNKTICIALKIYEIPYEQQENLFKHEITVRINIPLWI